MWSDLDSDPERCPGSGERGEQAETLADGYPHGRALCRACLRFVPLTPNGTLADHDTSDAAESDAEVRRRREWFNTFGW